MTYFISGHRDLKQEEFDKWYAPILEKAMEKDPWAKFVVGDYFGADEMAQTWLSNNMKDKSNVTVFHMFKNPRILVDKDFNTRGNFKSDVERDSAMTSASDTDIAIIGDKRWTSGTAQNILRRYERAR